MIKCFLDLSDFVAAAQTIEGMSTSRRSDRLTQFLSYGLAIRVKDARASTHPDSSSASPFDRFTAQLFLNSPRSTYSDDSRFLLATIGEAMNQDTKFNIVSILRPFLDEDEDGPCLSPAVHVPTLLRLTACILISASEQGTDDKDEATVMICAIFRAAAVSVHNAQNESTIEAKFRPEDMKWFERTGYKLALKKLHTWPLKYTIDLLHWVCEVSSSKFNLKSI